MGRDKGLSTYLEEASVTCIVFEDVQQTGAALRDAKHRHPLMQAPCKVGTAKSTSLKTHYTTSNHSSHCTCREPYASRNPGSPYAN